MIPEQREKVMAKTKELGDIVKRARLAVVGAIEEFYEARKSRAPNDTSEQAVYIAALCATEIEARNTFEKFLEKPLDPAWYPRTFL